VSSSEATQSPYHRLRIAHVIDETADARSFVLEIPEELREAFAYRAGQFLTFRVQVGEERLVRCYSLSSSPDCESEHKVTIKRVEEGRVSNHLNDQVVAGTVLEVMRPAGRFCLRDRNAPVVLFGGGSGITPVISIAKTALVSTRRSVKLVYANRDEESIIFRAELDALARTHGERFDLVHRLDDLHGFLDAGEVARQVESLRDADFYLCGPTAFMETVEHALHELGVDPERVFVEHFVSLASEEQIPDDVSFDPGEGELPHSITIELDGATHDIPYRPGDTVLETVRRAGMDPPFSCEDGYCGCCMARVLEGEVEMRMNDGGVDERQIAEGWTLTCQGLPKSPKVRIKYPE